MDTNQILQDIVNDGYLSETNLARAREALANLRPEDRVVNRSLVAKWLAFTSPQIRDKFIIEFP